MRGTFLPNFSQITVCLQASLSAISPILTMRPFSSAIGIKISGEI